MRIYLKTTANTEIVPFDYQQKLVGTLYKWLETSNEEHGNLSLYSFSWLVNGKQVKNGLDFSSGAKWFISFLYEDRIKSIINTILRDPEMFCGMSVTDITIEETPDLSKRELFNLGSPIHIKRKNNDGTFKHYTYEDEESNKLMEEILLHKMKVANLPEDETLSIRFNLDYTNKKVKLITYKGIGNKASMCPIIIKGKAETKAFAWNVGIGNSTGIGFGSIY